MRTTSQLKVNNKSFLTRLPKDIRNLIWDYLSKADQDSLRQCSKNMYHLIQNHQIENLYAANCNDQLSALVKLALHIHKVEDGDVDLIIHGIRKLSEISYPKPEIAAIALTCLAKLTTLSPAERTQRILALNQISPVLTRNLSYMLVQNFNNLSLSVSNTPCTIDELHTFQKPIVLLCFSLLGLKLKIESGSSVIDKFHTLVRDMPMWIRPMLITPLIYSHSLLTPHSLTSEIALQALPLAIKEYVKDSCSYSINVFGSLIRNINSSHREEAWNIIYSNLNEIESTQKRHDIITGSLPLFKQSKKMLLNLQRLLIKELTPKKTCSITGCLCASKWLDTLIEHVSHQSLNLIIPKLSYILMYRSESLSLWATLIRGVHNADLAAIVLHIISDELFSSRKSCPPNINIQQQLAKLLNPNFAAQLFDVMPNKLFLDNQNLKSFELMELLAKMINPEHAIKPLNQLLDHPFKIPFFYAVKIAEIVLALAKNIDTQGDKILLPLLLKVIDPTIDFNFVDDQNLNVKLIIDFIYENQSQPKNDDFKINLLKKVYADLNYTQIQNIWSYLIKQFDIDKEMNVSFLSTMMELACQFPSINLMGADTFIINCIQDMRLCENSILLLLENIHKVNLLSEDKILDILNTTIRRSDFARFAYGFLTHLSTLVRKYNSEHFQNIVFEILLRILAKGDERIYTRLERLHNENTTESLLFAKTIIVHTNSLNHIELLPIFLALTKAERFNRAYPLLKAWLLSGTDTPTFILLAHIHLLNQDVVNTLHKRIIDIMPYLLACLDYGYEIEAHFPKYLAFLSESQQVELFNSIYSLRTLTPAHIRLLIIFIANFKKPSSTDYIALIAKRKELQTTIGHHFPIEICMEILPVSTTFESFFPDYLDLFELSKAKDIISSLNILVTCIKKINDIKGIDEPTKLSYALTLISRIRKIKHSNGDSELIQHLVLLQLTFEYQSPELSFIFTEPQHENVLLRFKALLASISKPITGINFEALAELNHHYAALILISSLTTFKKIENCKYQALEYIKAYCCLVTHVDRLDELTQALLNARHNVLAHIFHRNTTYSARGDSLQANRLRQFGIFENESCSHTAVKIFDIIEEKKKELLATMGNISHAK